MVSLLRFHYGSVYADTTCVHGYFRGCIALTVAYAHGQHHRRCGEHWACHEPVDLRDRHIWDSASFSAEFRGFERNRHCCPGSGTVRLVGSDHDSTVASGGTERDDHDRKAYNGRNARFNDFYEWSFDGSGSGYITPIPSAPRPSGRAIGVIGILSLAAL